MTERVLVGSIAADGGEQVARLLRDRGQEVIYAGSFDDYQVGGAELVRAAVQEDATAIDVTVTARQEKQVDQYLDVTLAAYHAADILVDLHYPVQDELRDQWMELGGVGPTNGQLLSESGMDPETATFRDIWNALETGYVDRMQDEEQGKKAGRGQAKRIKLYNRERYEDHPTPGHQSSLNWWTARYGENQG